MSATIVREKNQTTLPADVLAQAGIRPRDQVEWRFQDGEIRGRKLMSAETGPVETLEIEDVDPKTFMPKKMGRVTSASIRDFIRAARPGGE